MSPNKTAPVTVCTSREMRNPEYAVSSVSTPIAAVPGSQPSLHQHTPHSRVRGGTSEKQDVMQLPPVLARLDHQAFPLNGQELSQVKPFRPAVQAVLRGGFISAMA